MDQRTGNKRNRRTNEISGIREAIEHKFKVIDRLGVKDDSSDRGKIIRAILGRINFTHFYLFFRRKRFHEKKLSKKNWVVFLMPKVRKKNGVFGEVENFPVDIWGIFGKIFKKLRYKTGKFCSSKLRNCDSNIK